MGKGYSEQRRGPARSARVIGGHTSAYPDPLIVTAGEWLEVEDRISEWPGWIWGRSESGRGGWVPEKYVEKSGSKARMLRDYDARELDVKAGQGLMVLEEQSGWVWCRDENGRCGWVPTDSIRLDQE